MSLFQSTRPRGARPRDCLPGSAGTPFQSTRPRGARQQSHCQDQNGWQVSIHAPAWGATWSGSSGLRAGRGFQSTRPRGARRLRRPEIGRVRVVSIHAPAWGATRHGARDNAHRVVSIHAPAWGATTTRWWRSPTVLSFNPRARVGRDGLFPGLRARQDAFQSTRPRGARPGRPAGKSVSPGFQSTRPRGARPEQFPHLFALREVSIHAPAWGATIRHGAERVGMDSFNPRARVGRDYISHWNLPYDSKFQSTRPRGARPGTPPAALRAATFQSTRPRGARRP